MDRVCPGYLGDLKSFSKDYESESQDKYQSLRDRLSQPVDGAPPISCGGSRATLRGICPRSGRFRIVSKCLRSRQRHMRRLCAAETIWERVAEGQSSRSFRNCGAFLFSQTILEKIIC
jgi:hypothetical protein